MAGFKTPQEEFWAGEFGDEYVDRNKGSRLLASNTALFTRILSRTSRIDSVLELGASVGLNLMAIRQLLPGASLAGVEINQKAADEQERSGVVEVHRTTILSFEAQRTWDLVLIKGVLIHINPEELGRVYDLMYKCSSRYICIAEYYNPTPETILYREHRDRLFKRDFAGEMLERYPDLMLIDYGFAYHRDNNWPQDDITWFLLEKPES
jgi:spore coat polysaccharide biosynthesis protein SpsF